LAGDVGQRVVKPVAVVGHGAVDLPAAVLDCKLHSAAAVLDAVGDQLGDHELEVGNDIAVQCVGEVITNG
jgi:hypothetical protein